MRMHFKIWKHLWFLAFFLGGGGFLSLYTKSASACSESFGGASGKVGGEYVLSLKEAEDLNEMVSCVGVKMARSKATLPPVVRFVLPPGVIRLNAPVAVPDIFEKRGVGIVFSADIKQKSVLVGSLPFGDIRPRSTSKSGRGVYSVKVGGRLAEMIKVGNSFDHGSKLSLVAPELIVDGVLFRMSSWPQDGFGRVEAISESGDGVVVDGIRLDARTDSAFIHGFFFHDWADSQRRVEHYDESRRTMVLGTPNIRYGIKIGARVQVTNLTGQINRHGVYAIPKASDEVQFFSDGSPRSVEFTNIESAFLGKAKNLEVSNIDLEGFRGSAIDLYGDDIRVKNVRVRNVGLGGVRIRGDGSVVSNVVVQNVGSIGIDFVGGDREKLIPANSVIKDCLVEQFGRLRWSANPGIRVFGVGVSVISNIVRDGPHAGIFYFGNDHTIRGNEVSRVALLTDDVGAIYTGQDWTGRGNVVEFNFVHDIHGVSKSGATAFYVDDQASGVLLRNNIAANVDRGVLIGGGRDNQVVGNVVFNAIECIKVDARGTTWQAQGTRVGKVLAEKLENALKGGDRYLNRYPELKSLVSDSSGLPVGNVVRGNFGDCESIFVKEARFVGQIEPFAKLSMLPNTWADALGSNVPIEKLRKIWAKGSPISQ